MVSFVFIVVFMGSAKYPDENEFDAFIKKHGGSDNASTDCERVNKGFFSTLIVGKACSLKAVNNILGKTFSQMSILIIYCFSLGQSLYHAASSLIALLAFHFLFIVWSVTPSACNCTSLEKMLMSITLFLHFWKFVTIKYMYIN